MKSYHTAGSCEGLTLPHSGFLIGRLAESLRLKGAIFESAGRTARRFFAGKRIKSDQIESILTALVKDLVPEELTILEGRVSLRDVIRLSIPFYARVWDRLAADINSNSYPIGSRSDLPIPVLRLVFLDLGLRWGAFGCLQFLSGKRPTFDQALVGPKALGTFLDRLRDQLSIREFAEKIGVTTQALHGWRTGEALPTSANVEAVANAVAVDEEADRLDHRLRLVVGIQSVRNDLVETCGAERIEDMIAAMIRTAEIMYEAYRDELVRGSVAGPKTTEALLEVVRLGVRCPLGASLAGMLAQRAAGRPETAADFAALPGDWTDRVSYWARTPGSVPTNIESLRQHATELGFDQNDAVAGEQAALEAILFRMRGFDERLAPSANRAALTAEVEAILCSHRGEIARSLERHEEAIRELRRAVALQPRNPSYHFRLGAYLGEWGNKVRDGGIMEQAVLECRIAVHLDPAFGNARNEIGLILSNMRRHEEAEAAFAEAEAYHGDNSHHWFTRGGNFVALGRLEDARAAYEKAIDLTRGKIHDVAMARLAAVLMKLGQQGRAKRLGAKVDHLAGFDPTKDCERVLDIWHDLDPT